MKKFLVLLITALLFCACSSTPHYDANLEVVDGEIYYSQPS